MSIREATPADLPRLVEMGCRFLAETEPYRSRVVGDPGAMTATAENLIAQDNGGVFVVDREGTLVGMIGLLLYPHHLSGEWTAVEVFWWCEPEYRGQGVRLLKRAEQWAAGAGATRMQMIAPSADVGALYSRMGYHPLEIAYERTL